MVSRGHACTQNILSHIFNLKNKKNYFGAGAQFHLTKETEY